MSTRKHFDLTLSHNQLKKVIDAHVLQHIPILGFFEHRQRISVSDMHPLQVPINSILVAFDVHNVKRLCFGCLSVRRCD